MKTILHMLCLAVLLGLSACSGLNCAGGGGGSSAIGGCALSRGF